MSSLFRNFTTTSYNGSTATNLMLRAAYNEVVKSKSVLFYPYTVSEGERPDTIAGNYYGDPKYDWVVMLTNDIVDPYYDWPLSNYDFYQFVSGKYGSATAAQESTAFWRVNWYNDDRTLSVAAYEALSSVLKKYWTLDSELGTQYVRKPIDTAVETNKTIEVTVASATGFVVGEKISQTVDDEITASGTILLINDNTLVCKNITGTFVESVDTDGATSLTSSNTTDVTVIKVSIPDAEIAYWESVSHYDYENELNENKKHINLLDKAHLSRLEKEIRDMFL